MTLKTIYCPGGTTDRSLARSAWKSPLKAPSRRVRYDRVVVARIELDRSERAEFQDRMDPDSSC